MNDNQFELSVIIPVTERGRDSNIKTLHNAYKKGLEQTELLYEMIYILDGEFPEVFQSLQELRENGENLKVVKLGKWFGETTAMSVGFEESSAELLLTLPAYQQIRENEIPKVVNSLKDYDMTVGCRSPRIDGFLNRLQHKIFHKLVKFMTGFEFNDLGSGVRGFKRKVIDEVQIYGDQHRFIPLLVSRHGFKVKEVNVSQAKQDAFKRVYSPGIYIRRLLDLLSVFFLIKFTKKPLRFFGLSGLFVFIIGSILALILAIQRLFFDIALADRPIVLVSLLLIVLGIQIFAIGLIGEIIIFTHAKDLKEYTIEQIFKSKE